MPGRVNGTHGIIRDWASALARAWIIPESFRSTPHDARPLARSCRFGEKRTAYQSMAIAVFARAPRSGPKLMPAQATPEQAVPSLTKQAVWLLTAKVIGFGMSLFAPLI